MVVYETPSYEYFQLTVVRLGSPLIDMIMHPEVAPEKVLMSGRAALAVGKSWNNDVNKLIKTTRITLFIFIMVSASHLRLP